MAYTTRADVKTFLGISDTSDDTLLDALIVTAQQMVDDYCGRTFEASADSTRYFDAVAPTRVGRMLYLDRDLCQITSVVNGDGETIGSGVYQTVPPDPPYHALALLTSMGVSWEWVDEPERAIAVTGRWAYAVAAPAPVVHATKEVVAWLYRSYDRQARPGAGEQLPATSGGELPATVLALLAGYRRL